jgi:hypothetical protein
VSIDHQRVPELHQPPLAHTRSASASNGNGSIVVPRVESNMLNHRCVVILQESPNSVSKVLELRRVYFFRDGHVVASTNDTCGRDGFVRRHVTRKTCRRMTRPLPSPPYAFCPYVTGMSFER